MCCLALPVVCFKCSNILFAACTGATSAMRGVTLLGIARIVAAGVAGEQLMILLFRNSLLLVANGISLAVRLLLWLPATETAVVWVSCTSCQQS